MFLKQATLKAKTTALPFVVGLSLYTIVGSGLFFTYGKVGTHEILNAYHTPYLNIAFKYITHVGHGLVPLALFHLLLLVRYSWAVGLGVSSLLMGLVVQVLKRSVFAGDHRPAMYFPDGGLPVIDGIDLMTQHSFPSGHSATAFCTCLMLAFFIKQKWATLVLTALALITAFSRVYISQHFIQDTIVGAWIGLIAALFAYVFIVYKAEANPFSKMNKRLWPS